MFSVMAVQDVRDYLDKWGKGALVQELTASCATVDLAAAALGVEAARIAKTLAFAGGKGCILIVAAGDSKVHGSKFKQRFGCKSNMLRPEDTLFFTGHAVGGVCPFAISNAEVEVYLDISLQRFATVFPACGSSNSMIELSCDDLFVCANAEGWVDVCKGWQVEES